MQSPFLGLIVFAIILLSNLVRNWRARKYESGVEAKPSSADANSGSGDADKGPTGGPSILVRRLAQLLNTAGIGLPLWVLFWPYPYWLLVVYQAVLPAVAVILTILFPKLFCLGRTSDGRFDIWNAYWAPAWGLFLRMFYSYDMIDWKPLIVATLICTALTTLIMTRRNMPIGMLFWTILTAAYWAGAIGEANALFDRSPGTVFRSKVLDRYIQDDSHTRHPTGLHYYIGLSPWGPLSAAYDVEVGQSVYDQVGDSGFACVHFHPGAFGLGWASVSACDW